MDKQKQLEKIANLAEVVKATREAFTRQGSMREAAHQDWERASLAYQTAEQEFDKACTELTEAKPQPSLVGPKGVPAIP